MSKNYLACINYQDKNNLINKFINSLSGIAENKRYFDGWSSTLSEMVPKWEDKNRDKNPNQSYLLFQANSDEKINKEYFVQHEGGFLTEIENLQIKVLFQEDDDGFIGIRESLIQGKYSPEEAIKQYEKSKRNIKYLFTDVMEKRPAAIIKFFPERFIGIGRKKKTLNVKTFISLETILPANNILLTNESDAWVYHRQ